MTVSGTLLETTDFGFGPFDIVAGPDGNLWFTDPGGNTIGRVTPSGPTITQFTIPTAFGTPNGIASGFDGRLWFTERNAGKIGRITTDGANIDEFPIPSGLQPILIARGPDGALWFTEGLFVVAGRVSEPISLQIGRIDTTGAITEFPALGAGASLFGIATGSDGALWFTDTGMNNAIGRITPQGM